MGLNEVFHQIAEGGAIGAVLPALLAGVNASCDLHVDLIRQGAGLLNRYFLPAQPDLGRLSLDPAEHVERSHAVRCEAVSEPRGFHIENPRLGLPSRNREAGKPLFRKRKASGLGPLGSRLGHGHPFPVLRQCYGIGQQ